MRLRGLYAGNVGAVLERGFMAIKSQNWIVIASGFFEPVFYLLAMGLGLGALIKTVSGPGGVEISYSAYIAPALLASAAMNGAIYDSTFNVFFKLRYSRLYQTMLQAPLGPLDVALGEIGLALFRGLLYASGFLVVMAMMGITTSWWALLMIPSAVLVALGFASIGMAITSFMKSFQQMDVVSFVLLPMFLFSATLYPITVYPQVVQWLVMAMPLWHAVELMRALAVGYFAPATFFHMIYFVGMSVLGIAATTKRLRTLFLR